MTDIRVCFDSFKIDIHHLGLIQFTIDDPGYLYSLNLCYSLDTIGKKSLTDVFNKHDECSLFTGYNFKCIIS